MASWVEALKSRRNSLKATTTTITDATGKRYVETPDGAIPLPTDLQDEDGNWAVMDDAAATGVGSGAAPRPNRGACGSETQELRALVAKEPRLAKYVRLIKQPIHRDALVQKMRFDGVDEAAAREFVAAMGPGDAPRETPADPFAGVEWRERFRRADIS